MTADAPRLRSISLAPFDANCYVLACRRTSLAAIIDPGGEPGRIRSTLLSLQARPAWIIATHGHVDHIGACATLSEWFPESRFALHAADADCLQDPEQNLSARFGHPSRGVPPARCLEDGEVVSFGDVCLRVLHTPGHTPGHLCLHLAFADDREADWLFSGDALFRGRVGRTDFPGGDPELMQRSLARLVAELPTDTIVHPGHGPATVLSAEIEANPAVSRK